MEEKVSKLVALIEAKLGNKLPAGKPTLKIVKPVEVVDALPGMDSATRHSHIRLIRSMAKRHRLEVLVHQATFGRTNLEDLPDGDLARLHADIHRALDYGAAGVSLEEAGLIRNPTAHLDRQF